MQAIKLDRAGALSFGGLGHDGRNFFAFEGLYNYGSPPHDPSDMAYVRCVSADRKEWVSAHIGQSTNMHWRSCIDGTTEPVSEKNRLTTSRFGGMILYGRNQMYNYRSFGFFGIWFKPDWTVDNLVSGSFGSYTGLATYLRGYHVFDVPGTDLYFDPLGRLIDPQSEEPIYRTHESQFHAAGDTVIHYSTSSLFSQPIGRLANGKGGTGYQINLPFSDSPKYAGGPIRQATVSPSGKTIAVVSGYLLSLYTHQGVRLAAFPLLDEDGRDALTHAVWSPDGLTVGTMSWDGQLFIIDNDWE